MTDLPTIAAAITRWLEDPTPSPSPLPAFEGDPNLVTPGVIGFIAIAVVAIATVFLVMDMTRRIRRVRYRAEVREQLRAESEESGAVSPPAED